MVARRLAPLGLAALTACGPGGGAAPAHDAGAQPPPPPLAAPAAAPLALGAVRLLPAPLPLRTFYRVAVPRGHFLHVAAEQQGVDVLLTLHDASGRALVSVDS